MSELYATTYKLVPGDKIPNNSKLPVLYYKQVLGSKAPFTAQFKAAFEKNNWKGIWVNGIFNYHHYHSTSHEVLGVAAGSAEVILGGPDGKVFNLEAGDMVVLPAGTGHCLKHASPDFKVVGAYPNGQQSYDICTQDTDPEAKVKTIAQVPLPAQDPVGGTTGPLVEIWGRAKQT
ncbi:cupin domain-containing protein [uncultured Pontibacter sp.]|uniref:cupin domain-containing protein n=1 Tax=uncultured Pontibacter sp. TaxID=453356 RepID=UPI002625FB95|nr:cupin domain-containing protein [uncultured Pontibacter sp.]